MNSEWNWSCARQKLITHNPVIWRNEISSMKGASNHSIPFHSFHQQHSIHPFNQFKTWIDFINGLVFCWFIHFTSFHYWFIVLIGWKWRKPSFSRQLKKNGRKEGYACRRPFHPNQTLSYFIHSLINSINKRQLKLN